METTKYRIYHLGDAPIELGFKVGQIVSGEQMKAIYWINNSIKYRKKALIEYYDMRYDDRHNKAYDLKESDYYNELYGGERIHTEFINMVKNKELPNE